MGHKVKNPVKKEGHIKPDYAGAREINNHAHRGMVKTHIYY